MLLLAVPLTAELDRLFPESTVAHHEGAVAMAGAEPADGADERARALAQEIADSQEAEIAEMQEMPGGASSDGPGGPSEEEHGGR
ncbi:DUF305 domain-containing protein [Nocardiopsis flavescens]|uniref:DUF305 domain-containing protein n=1 Tax=Nocardiopsis flavescens TaxID=758803 RepID=UPI0015B8D7F1|nr:DUF305 domain-containing protein [Nocardiopsis flavescens]